MEGAMVSALEAKVTKQSRDVVRLQAEDAAELYRHGRVPLTFSILEQGDGGTIQIIYTGVRHIAAGRPPDSHTAPLIA